MYFSNIPHVQKRIIFRIVVFIGNGNMKLFNQFREQNLAVSCDGIIRIIVVEIHSIRQYEVAQAVGHKRQATDISVFLEDFRLDRYHFTASTFMNDDMIQLVAVVESLVRVCICGQVCMHVHRFRQGNADRKLAFMDFLFSVDKGNIESCVAGHGAGPGFGFFCGRNRFLSDCSRFFLGCCFFCCFRKCFCFCNHGLGHVFRGPGHFHHGGSLRHLHEFHISGDCIAGDHLDQFIQVVAFMYGKLRNRSGGDFVLQDFHGHELTDQFREAFLFLLDSVRIRVGQEDVIDRFAFVHGNSHDDFIKEGDRGQVQIVVDCQRFLIAEDHGINDGVCNFVQFQHIGKQYGFFDPVECVGVRCRFFRLLFRFFVLFPGFVRRFCFGSRVGQEDLIDVCAFVCGNRQGYCIKEGSCGQLQVLVHGHGFFVAGNSGIDNGKFNAVRLQDIGNQDKVANTVEGVGKLLLGLFPFFFINIGSFTLIRSGVQTGVCFHGLFFFCLFCLFCLFCFYFLIGFFIYFFGNNAFEGISVEDHAVCHKGRVQPGVVPERALADHGQPAVLIQQDRLQVRAVCERIAVDNRHGSRYINSPDYHVSGKGLVADLVNAVRDGNRLVTSVVFDKGISSDLKDHRFFDGIFFAAGIAFFTGGCFVRGFSFFFYRFITLARFIAVGGFFIFLAVFVFFAVFVFSSFFISGVVFAVFSCFFCSPFFAGFLVFAVCRFIAGGIFVLFAVSSFIAAGRFTAGGVLIFIAVCVFRGFLVFRLFAVPCFFYIIIVLFCNIIFFRIGIFRIRGFTGRGSFFVLGGFIRYFGLFFFDGFFRRGSGFRRNRFLRFGLFFCGRGLFHRNRLLCFGRLCRCGRFTDRRRFAFCVHSDCELAGSAVFLRTENQQVAVR